MAEVHDENSATKIVYVDYVALSFRNRFRRKVLPLSKKHGVAAQKISFPEIDTSIVERVS